MIDLEFAEFAVSAWQIDGVLTAHPPKRRPSPLSKRLSKWAGHVVLTAGLVGMLPLTSLHAGGPSAAVESTALHRELLPSTRDRAARADPDYIPAGHWPKMLALLESQPTAPPDSDDDYIEPFI